MRSDGRFAWCGGTASARASAPGVSRPNGFLWVQLIRLTPSEVEVRARQIATGQVSYYQIDPAAPGAGVLDGIEDRTAFQA